MCVSVVLTFTRSSFWALLAGFLELAAPPRHPRYKELYLGWLCQGRGYYGQPPQNCWVSTQPDEAGARVWGAEVAWGDVMLLVYRLPTRLCREVPDGPCWGRVPPHRGLSYP